MWHAGPGLSESNAHQLIFHPLTGLCVLRRSEFEPLTLGLCTKSEASWSYTLDKILSPKGTNFCIQANGPGMPAKLSNICNNSDSKWEIISDSMLHLSSTLADGSTICLDFKGNIVMTNTCICLSDNNVCDPSSQWFKLIRSTRSWSSTKSNSSLVSLHPTWVWEGCQNISSICLGPIYCLIEHSYYL